MPSLRSRTVTHGRNMAGARALLRATGVAREDIGKPIIAVANSFTEFVPGHVHLREVGQVVSDAIRAAGAIPREFNTIAVDDGIAMGHSGMLYSLPSRELIADSVEAGTPAGLPGSAGARLKLDLIDPMIASADPSVSDEQLAEMEESACPTCGSCSGMFTANSMNCLAEAIGLALPGNGTTLATHAARRGLFERAGRLIAEITRQYYPRRELRLDVPDAALALRRDRVLTSLGSYRPADRQRPVSAALQVYAAMATSASTGAARDITLLAQRGT